MENSKTAMLAPCGIDCGGCNLFRAVSDERAAESLVAWFRKQGWLKADEGAKEIMSRGPYCNGCRGDRSVQWSGDCKLRKCCLDDGHLESCSECVEFPCEKLLAWGQKPPHHAEALKRLRAMRASRTAPG